MSSPELLRVEASECRRGAIGKSARVERTLLALAERLESEATILEARESPDRRGGKLSASAPISVHSPLARVALPAPPSNCRRSTYRRTDRPTVGVRLLGRA